MMMRITRTQLKMAVAAVGVTVDKAQEKLNISRSTLYSLTSSDEAMARAKDLTVMHVKGRLESMGVEFLEGGWVRMKSDSETEQS